MDKRRTYTKDILADIAKEHKEHFTSSRNWIRHSQENKLPAYCTYISQFESWNNAHKEIFGTHKEKNEGKGGMSKHPKAELIQIAWEHKDAFTTGLNWTSYAKENDLPSANYYMRKFNGWKNAHKEIFGGPEEWRGHHKYPKEKLTQIAREHKEEFTTVSNWTVYAKQSDLPSVTTYIGAFKSWDKAHIEIFGASKKRIENRKYTKEQLIQVAREHKDAFTTQLNWTAYASENDLYNHSFYVRTFGSWKNAHKEIFGCYIGKK